MHYHRKKAIADLVIFPDTQAAYADNVRFTRGRECIKGVNPPRGFVCGSETTADSLIKDYCESTGGIADLAECPDTYPRLNPALNPDTDVVSVPAIGTGANQLLNSDGSGALAIFPVDVTRGRFLATNFIEVAAAGISPLNLNFTSKTFANGEDGFAFTVDGKFTRNGVIYGTVNFANTGYGVGTLTGLIGADGVVGIFKSDDTVYVRTTSRYVGGFIAEPTPADVTAIGFKANALQNNGMDKLIVLDSGAPDTANADTVNFIEGGAVGTGFENATMKISLPINTGGGVAFAYGDSGTANNYHVGILADTNVGPALNNDVTGDWVGKIQAIVNGSDTTEQAITFNVNFGANSFAIKDGTAPTFANIGAMTMDGNFTDTGVIYGSVYFGGANTNTGMLTGLIGQNALVGAFAGNGGLANPYVGGFIANKPTQ